MKKFKVKESRSFFLFFSLLFLEILSRGGNSSSTRKLNLATIHPMSIRSLYRLCPPWTRFRRRRKLWKKVVYSWERVWLLVYRFVFFLRDATWNGSLPLWTETRLNLRGMLLFDNETPSWFSTQPSLFLLSFFLFFFLRYTFLFARFEEKTRTFECI